MQTVRTVVEEVAQCEDTKPSDLPPLYESINPEALETVVNSPSGGPVSVEFDYCDYTVNINADGSVEVEE